MHAIPWTALTSRFRPDLMVAGVVFLLVFFAVWKSPMISFGSRSDPEGCLLTSQTLLQKGTVDLGGYPADWLKKRYGYKCRIVEGRTIYYFPIGNSLLAVPAVAVANARGKNMAKPADDRDLQRLLAALTAGLCAVLVWILSRHACPLPLALLQTAGFALGTSLCSTLGSGFWSHNTSVLFTLAALVLLVKTKDFKAAPVPEVLALLLFLSYLCRPTAALFLMLALLFVWTRDRAAAVRTGLALIPLFGLLVLFSMMEYKSLLPPYYMSRFSATGQTWTTLAGLLASPSRGLFVFSPFLLVPLLYLARDRTWLTREPLALLMLLWIGLHVASVCHFWNWWGGYCFGPRLLTDVLPAFLVIHTLYFRSVNTAGGKMKAGFLAVSAVTIAFSIWVHLVQGLYSTATARWNTVHDIQQHPERLFNWSHPQWLAAKEDMPARPLKPEPRDNGQGGTDAPVLPAP